MPKVALNTIIEERHKEWLRHKAHELSTPDKRTSEAEVLRLTIQQAMDAEKKPQD